MLQYPIWAKGFQILSQCMSASYALPIFFSRAKKHRRESPEALPSSVHTNFLIRIDPRHPETLIFGILPKMSAYETDMGQGLGPAGAHGPGRTLVRARAQGPGRTLARAYLR